MVFNKEEIWVKYEPNLSLGNIDGRQVKRIEASLNKDRRWTSEEKIVIVLKELRGTVVNGNE